MLDTRMCKKLGALAGAAVFCCVSAIGQSTGSGAGGAMQNGANQGSQAAQQGANSMGNMANSGMNSMNGSMTDKAFLKKAMQGGMAEVQTAQLALTKSNNDQVKQFAQMMIDDHTKMNDQAKPIAQQNGVAVPSAPDKKSQAMMAKLQGMSGDAFDKAYIQDMVKDHQQDEKDFKAEASNGQNPQIKDLASQGEPIIAGHLQKVQQLAKSMNVSGGM